MGHRLLLQRLPAAWNCSFIQYGKQVAGAALAIVASYQQNCARAYTKSGCLLCASICVCNQDTGQRNSVPPTAPLNNHQNDPVVYLHFGELAQCLYLHCLLSTITEPRLCTLTQALPQCLPVLPPVDYRPWTCICTHTRANLPALPPLDNPPQPCTCTHTRARLLNPTDAASCQHRSSTRTGTNIRASWHSSCRCCIASTSGPGQVYAHMVSQAGTVHTGVASC